MAATDAQLVERARGGDAGAFELLVRRYLRAAYAVALAELGDPAEAEDACQDALVTALEKLEECRQPERFARWLLQIVRNRARSLRRRSAVRAANSLEEVRGLPGTARPDRDAERAELRSRLLAALATLTPVQREVVLLHDLEGWRHREIADWLGLPEGTVRSHLFHARRALRARLGAGLLVEDADAAGSD